MVPRFQGGKREELIGITYNRLIRMDASTGDAIKTWRFSNMKQWNVNWEIKMVGGSHGEEEDCGCTDRQTDRQTQTHHVIKAIDLGSKKRCCLSANICTVHYRKSINNTKQILTILSNMTSMTIALPALVCL